MLKKKQKIDFVTHTRQLTDTATGDKGNVAYHTFNQEDIEITNEYLVPFGAIDYAVVNMTTEDVEANDTTCVRDGPVPPTPTEPYFDGITDATINQGTDFDLKDGVKAYDADGNEIPYTVNPSEIESCEVGVQTFEYEAEGVSATRNITVKAIAAPVISGLDELTVLAGEEFDPLDGVSAKDGNGNTVEVEVEVEEISTKATTLYSDGTLIINEFEVDRQANIATHGNVVDEYAPLDVKDAYIFSFENKAYWYEHASDITNVKFGSATKPTNMAYWFDGLKQVSSYDFTNLDTSENTSFARTFATNVSGALDVSDTLKIIDVSSLDTSNVNNFFSMFAGQKGLTEIVGLDNFDTSKATNVGSMFYSCGSLATINLSSFDTSKVIGSGFYTMFRRCAALKVLDISNFDMSNADNISGMFWECANLETIYVANDFEPTSKITASFESFRECFKLIGGNGTQFNANHINGAYARIDNPPEAPGYFTAKGE